MKKRLCFAFTCLFLCLCIPNALCENLLSINGLLGELQANPRWTAEYEAHGRKISVDIPIIAPEVESMPVIEAVVDDPITMDKQVMHSKRGELPIIGREGAFRKAEDSGLYAALNPGADKAEISYVRAGDVADDISDKIILVEYNPANRLLATNDGSDYLKYESESYYPYEIDPEQTYAEENPASLAEAVQCVQDILAYYFGEEEAEIEINTVEICGRARKTEGMDDYHLGEYASYYPAGTYKMSFCQKIKGIPVYMTAQKMYYNYSDSKITKWLDFSGTGRLECEAEIMSRETSYDVYARLLKTKRVIEEDVPLAGVQNVIRSIEQEIENGHIRNVYALRLGYTCFLNEHSPESFTLYPIWFLECDYAESAKQEIPENTWSDAFWDGYFFTTVAFNAQTGEMMGRELTEETQLMCPEIITWEDVQQ